MDQEGLRRRCWRSVKSGLATACQQCRHEFLSSHEQARRSRHFQRSTFEVDRLREAVYSGRELRIGGMLLQMLLSSLCVFRYYMSTHTSESSIFLHRSAVVALSCLCVLGVTLFAEQLLKTWLSRVKQHSCSEWYLMIVHQYVFITGFFLSSSLSMFHEDLLVAHRTFLIKMCSALFICSDPFYLPFAWHVFVFSGQGFACWMNFHYHMGFMKPTAIVCGCGLVLLEMWSFCKARQNIEVRAALAGELEKEKHARAMGEALKDALRGLLNVMFDAWCECDTYGHITVASQHLEQLLGESEHAYTGSELGELATNATERKRVIDFLAQTCTVKDPESKKNAFRPPAVLETALRHGEPLSDPSQSYIPVKLFCVPIPIAYTLEGQETHAGFEHLFIGLQQVQTHECISQNLGSEDIVHHQGNVEATDQNASTDASKSLHVASPSNGEMNLDSDSVLPLSTLELERHAAEPSLISSLTHTWTQLTEIRWERSSCEIGVQADMSSLGLVQNVGTQVDSSPSLDPVRIFKIASHPGLGRKRPPRPLSEVALMPEQVRHRRTQARGLCYKDFKQTRLETGMFLMGECLQKLNPEKRCCFYHSSLFFMKIVVKSMLSKQCSLVDPAAGKMFQCEQCLSLNFEEEDENEAASDYCDVCGVLRCQLDELDFREADVSSQIADISNSADSHGSDS